jgi:hypothetical protein
MKTLGKVVLAILVVAASIRFLSFITSFDWAVAIFIAVCAVASYGCLYYIVGDYQQSLTVLAESLTGDWIKDWGSTILVVGIFLGLGMYWSVVTMLIGSAVFCYMISTRRIAAFG